MMRMAVHVYRRYRKHPFFLQHERSTHLPHETYASVAVFKVTERQLQQIVSLESDERIRQHSREPVLIFTNGRRVHAISPEGYDYARYACVIDRDSAENILRSV
ncbi:hypothetical protein [Cohnella fermenti]|uniref:Uncharacterized protein n=1 Tax=Cohnella fermenti TaxID=2565925 RepID=A0A4S4BID9_9BACL|nr:hypothetical protein [Cohnella fermenti]THF74376.1 hypothetical protein E6C55_25370 [Cohnella fermenti]